MKRCKHDETAWDVTTVEDYEREHGERVWMDDRTPGEVVSVFCTKCGRQLALDDAEEGVEARAAEIAAAVEPWLDGFVPRSWASGHRRRLSDLEFVGIVGYLCDASFDPSTTAEDAGWLAHAIVAQEPGPVVAPHRLFDSFKDQQRARALAEPLFREEAAELDRRLRAREADIARFAQQVDDLERALDVANGVSPAVTRVLSSEVERALDGETTPDPTQALVDLFKVDPTTEPR